MRCRRVPSIEQYAQNPPKAEWTATIQGKSIIVKANRYRQIPEQQSTRGTVKNFSAKARLRMLRFLATVDWNRVGESSFITLTYPDKVIHKDAKKRNRERYLFHRYMEKHSRTKLSGVWRVEWKPRLSGVNKGKLLPHIHLLTFGDSSIEKSTVRESWRNITHAVGRLEVDAQRVPAGDVVSMYVAKYCTKIPDSPCLDNVPYLNSIGRHYGFTRKAMIPSHPKTVIALRDEALVEWLRRVASRQIASYDFRFSEGFTLLGDITEHVKKQIFENDLAEVIGEW